MSNTRIASLLLTILLWAGACAPAWAQQYDVLVSEADRAKALVADTLRQHGSDNEACLKAAQAVAARRFGAYGEGRLQLLAGAEAVAYQRRLHPVSVIEAVAGGCGWTHVGAYYEFKTHYLSQQRATKATVTRAPLQPPIETQMVDSPWLLGTWHWLLGGLVLVAVAVALGGAARAMLRARRADLAAREAGIPVPVPSTGSNHPVLDELLQERAKLIAELRAAGIEMSPQNGAPSSA